MNKNFREFNKRTIRLAGIKESRPLRRRRRLNESLKDEILQIKETMIEIFNVFNQVFITNINNGIPDGYGLLFNPKTNENTSITIDNISSIWRKYISLKTAEKTYKKNIDEIDEIPDGESKERMIKMLNNSFKQAIISFKTDAEKCLAKLNAEK